MSNIGRSREDELRDYQSIRERMLEEERKRKLEPLRRSSEESVKQLGESVKLQEENKGVSGTLLGSMMSSARDVFKREGYDNEYLRQIEDNNRTLSSLVKAKKENPEDEDRYNLMIDTIRAKNDILSNAVGGDLKNKTTAQLAALAVGTAAEMVPTLGGGMTKAGKAAILAEDAATAGYKTFGKKALSSMTGSIAKESAAIGAIGGTAEAFAAEDATLAERAAIIAGSTATSVLLGVIGSTLLKSGFNNLSKKLNRFKGGERVEFSPTEKSTIQSVSPEAKETKPFDTIGIKSPFADTEKDLMAKTVASTQEEKSIEKIIAKYVPENDVKTVSRILKNVNNPDEVVKIIDSFDPEAKRLAISKKIASTDNEKQVDNLISDIVPEKERATVSRLLSGMEDENQISKILADFEEKAPETPKTPKPQVEEPKKTVKATEDELEEEVGWYKAPDGFVVGKPKIYKGVEYTNIKTEASTADFAVDQYNSGWITNIETKPEFRNQGKAKELVKTGLMFLKERGVDIVRVIPENDISKRLFESFGFKKNGREFVLTKSQLTDIWKKAKGTKIETPKAKPKSVAQKVSGKSESPIIKRFNEKLDEAHKLDPDLPTTSHKEQLKLVAEEIAEDPQKVFNDGMYGSGTSGKTLKTTKLAAIIENARLKNDYQTRSEAIIAAARHGRKSGQEVEMFKALIENDPTNKGILDLVSARMGAVKSRYKKLVVKEGEDIVDAVVRNAKQKAKSITRKESAKRVASAKELIMSLSC